MLRISPSTARSAKPTLASLGQVGPAPPKIGQVWVQKGSRFGSRNLQVALISAYLEA